MDRDVLIFGKKLAAVRKGYFLTQQELAQRLELSAANVRRLEQSRTGGMRVRNFRRLAELLQLTPEELRGRIGASGQGAEDGQSESHLPPGLNLASIRPVVEVDLFHGVSAAQVEDRDDAVRDRSIIPAGSSRRFCVTVDGDCMQPRYQHGDVVVFSVDAADREGIVEGRNYFVQLADGSNTFKRIFFDPEDREVLILRPWNEKYPSRKVERRHIKLLARAIYRLLPDS